MVHRLSDRHIKVDINMQVLGFDPLYITVICLSSTCTSTQLTEALSLRQRDCITIVSGILTFHVLMRNIFLIKSHKLQHGYNHATICAKL